MVYEYSVIMSLQTSLESYFKSKANAKAANDNMSNKNKFKRRSLSLTRSPRPFKSPKKLIQQNSVNSGLKIEDEVICLSSSSEDLLTPPEQVHHDKLSQQKCKLKVKDGLTYKASSSENLPILPEKVKDDLMTNDSSNGNLSLLTASVTLPCNKVLASPNTSTDSSSTVVYTISPRALQTSPRTPSKSSQSPRSGKKFFSPTKKRLVTNKSPAKRSLTFETKDYNTKENSIDDNSPTKINFNFQDDKTLFLRSIIDQYLHNDSLKHLLAEESQVLLSNCMYVVEPGMRVVCRLYWRQPGWYQIDQLQQIASEKNNPISSPEMAEMLKSLVKNNLITSDECEGEKGMGFDEYVKLLKRPILQQICKELKLKMQSKQDAVEALRKFSQSSAISNFFTGKMGNNSDRVLKILRAKTGQCYKLSELARETLYNLYVLMYLGIDYTIIREKRLELILLHDKVNKETYPIDKDMILDNASVVFQNKDEFYRYLEAHKTYETYITSVDTQEKCDIVLQAYRLYTEIKHEDMLRYMSLPQWLRRFTPGNIYVKIMESGVQELKKVKSEEYYTRALDMLDLLIKQVVYRQHKKAEWYAEKALILHKYLDKSELAANTLLTGLKADLPTETSDILRVRASLLANQRSAAISDDTRLALRHYPELHALEKDMPADHIYKQPMDNHKQRGKLKFEAYTDEGRTTLTAEEYCILHYTQSGQYTHGEHWEGRIVTTIFHLLFWDIIYSKPPGVVGVFMCHYQRHPLDMYSDHFYTNRKTLIDDRLIFIEESTDDMIVEMLQSRWEERPESEVSDAARSMRWEDVASVVQCLSARGVSALCRRLALHYGHAHSGFPDLTLWNVQTRQIKFVEVKTDADKPSMKQLQWLKYLRDHGIDAGFCYVGANTTRCKARQRDSSS